MPLSVFFSPAEKISVIRPPSFITKTRGNKPYLQFLLKAFSFSFYPTALLFAQEVYF